MLLKPQDVLVLLKLVAIDAGSWTYHHLAIEIGMSSSEVHASAQRSISARLAVRMDEMLSPNISRLSEFLVRGIQYVFVPDRGAQTRGMPTSYAA